MFCFDVETLSVESDAVILSYAIVYFDPNDKPSYQELLDNTLFVKLDVKEQIQKHKRTINKDTLEWWNKQHDYVKSVSFNPSSKDVSAESAIQQLRQYVNKYPNNQSQTFWQRGSLDQVCIDSLCRALDLETITRYSNWRDLRTAIDIIYGSTNGYVEINHPEFDRNSVIKHVPYHDICLDVMMLLYGKPNE